MNITRATVISQNGMPVLDLLIDGHSAQVFEPKEALLEQGIVVLLDDDQHWAHTISAFYKENGGRTVRVRGATTDERLMGLVRRYAAGETGNLLAT